MSYGEPRGKHAYIRRDGTVDYLTYPRRGELKKEAVIPFTTEESGPEAEANQGQSASAKAGAHMRMVFV